MRFRSANIENYKVMEKSQTQFLAGVLEQIRALKKQAEDLESRLAAYLEDMDMPEESGTDGLFDSAVDGDLPESFENDDLPEMPEENACPVPEEQAEPELPAEQAGPAMTVEPERPVETGGPAAAAPAFDIELDDEIEIVPIGEAHAATGAVMDKMAEKESWRTDMPGSAVSDIRSAISLNDRILFINTLFHEDPIAFKEALSELNAMPSFEDGAEFILNLHPEWNTESEVVYRFMMAIRRKLK